MVDAKNNASFVEDFYVIGSHRREGLYFQSLINNVEALSKHEENLHIRPFSKEYHD